MVFFSSGWYRTLTANEKIDSRGRLEGLATFFQMGGFGFFSLKKKSGQITIYFSLQSPLNLKLMEI